MDIYTSETSSVERLLEEYKSLESNVSMGTKARVQQCVYRHLTAEISTFDDQGFAVDGAGAANEQPDRLISAKTLRLNQKYFFIQDSLLIPSQVSSTNIHSANRTHPQHWLACRNSDK